MRITEVEIQVVDPPRTGGRRDMLRAYCAITIDDVFVVHDLKVVQGANGLFISMPSRPLKDRCPECDGKNARLQDYCGCCGVRLDWSHLGADGGRFKVLADVAHPIRPRARVALDGAVLAAYRAECGRSPGRDGPSPRVIYDGAGNRLGEVTCPVAARS